MINADGTPAHDALPPDMDTSSRDPTMKAPLMAAVAMAWETLRAKRAREGGDEGMPKG